MPLVSLALAACATGAASRAELTELTASVRALRTDNARLEARLERLEQQLAVSGAKGAAPRQGVSVGAAPSKNELPSLTVVKVKPKREAAPKLSTNVAIVEPPEGIVEELRAPPGAAPAPEQDDADALVAEQQYQRGVDSLRTGNVEGGVTQLVQFTTDWPRHPQADNALYFAGLGQMSLEQWDGAARLFELASSKYPAGDAVVDSMLKLAECRVKQSRPQDAKATLERIVTSYPGTAAATQAQARLAAFAAPGSRSP